MTQKDIRYLAKSYDKEYSDLTDARNKVYVKIQILQKTCQHPKGKNTQPGGGFDCPDCLYSN